MMVSVLILAIAMSMTVTIGTDLLSHTTSQHLQAVAGGTGDVSLGELTNLIAGTVSPSEAAAAAGATATAAVPCWGTTNPSSPVKWISPWSQPSVTTPGGLTVIFAHDFDMEWCGYPPGSTIPHVYEAFIEPGSCLDTSAISGAPGSGVFGYCTLEVVDYTKTSATVLTNGFTTGDGFASVNSQTTDIDPYNAAPDDTGTYASNSYYSGAGFPGTVVETIPDVWCDAACQGGYESLSGASGSPEPPNSACSSWNAASATAPNSDCSGYSSGTSSNYTPPIFSYYSTTGPAGVTTPLNKESTPFDLANAADVTSLTTAGIDSVVVTIRVLPNVGNKTALAPNMASSALLTQQVTLANVTNAGGLG